MIDQLPTAVPHAAQPVNSSGRDRRQASPDQDEQAASFEDIVSKAGQHQTHQDRNESAEVDHAARPDAKERPDESRPKVAFELSAALRGIGTSAQTQAQSTPHVKSVVKDAAKVADRAAQAGREADVALGKLAEKLKQAARQTEQVAQRTRQVVHGAEADADRPLTASDELGLLLGLARETDVKHGKKPAETAKVEKKDEDLQNPQADKLARIDLHHAEHTAATADSKPAGGARASDESSSQGDVVRLVSASGRGRPVDIGVSAMPGEAHRETTKAANTPKLDTATVLDARRYLGFTPEPNATALATAIKADPTWTEALQQAQRSDLGTLGNTVTEVNTLKLQMNPENLGNMVASLKLKGEELTVELRVDSVEAYQQLSADHDDIVKSLQDQGFSIDKVTVQLNAIDRTDTGGDRDMARQGQAQRDGQAQQRDGQGGQSNRNDGQREQPRWAWSGAHPDSAADDRRADTGRSGNLYL